MKALILSASEVRACLTGHAVLWRPVWPPPQADADTLRDIPSTNKWYAAYVHAQTEFGTEYRPYPSDKQHHWRCPFGAPGDVMIGRETWCPSPDGPIYKASQHESGITGPDDYDVFRSPATMPAAIARIRMTVKAVDVRRVQESDVDVNEWNKRFPQTPWADNPWAWRVEVGT